MLTVFDVKFQPAKSTEKSSRAIVSLASESELPGMYGPIYRYSVPATKTVFENMKKTVGKEIYKTLEELLVDYNWKMVTNDKGYHWLYPADFEIKSQPKSSTTDNLDDLPF